MAMLGWRRLLLSIALICLGATTPVQAHIGFSSFQRVAIQENYVSVELRMAYDHVAALRLPKSGVATLADEIALSATSALSDGQTCPGSLEFSSADFATNSLIIRMRFDCPASVQSALLNLSAPSALGSSSLQYIEVTAKGRRDGFLRLSQASLFIDTALLGDLPMVVSYFVLGAEHIFLGLDHLAFLAALILGSTSIRAALLRATAFAVTHTVTLALTVLNIIAVDPAIVEPLIALSIAVAAADAFFRRSSILALSIAAVFGAVHGMGFGAGLAEAGLPAGQETAAIVIFTLGIEAAQIVIILAAFGLLRAVQGRLPAIQTSARITASLALIALGLFWFAERLTS
ncbi:MAG: HupE/UreJ family protein [Chitinophagales bacterium]|nr:HupE/UreJ family protein [Hyphomicrobiales bacterium]